MGKTAQQVDLVRNEPRYSHLATPSLALVQKQSPDYSSSHALLHPQHSNISFAVRPDRSVSYFDPVTSLPNRNHIFGALDEMIVSGVDDCAVLFVDLDNFRRINNSFGHEKGDSLLLAAGRRLQRFVTDQEWIVGRFGGDEFVVVVHGKRDRTTLNALAEQLVLELAYPHQFEGLSVSVTASIGIACFPGDATEAGELIQYAHTAMYAAKGMGGQGYRHFRQNMAAHAAESLLIEGRLRQALESNEFSLVFQPIARAGSNEIHIVEALLRWTNNRNEIVDPDQFIPVAEESGLIRDIGRWVLQEACQQASQWRRTRATPIVVSVNASPLQLANPKFCDDVQAAMDAAGLPPDLLVIEMTERMMVEEDAITSANIRRLTEMGVRVALDDFGTGYSSLSYLTRYQIQSIKIDRSFIGNIEFDLRARALVQAIIGIGKSLDVRMVAEGVESQGQAAVLESLGCDYLQGYLIGRPVSAEAL
ncbi:bifunctional diguanylate cyclase/phosphodiesterase [Noviherbaspirillum sp. L7-7A]|uniref:putative bifunctional diguanylate cyclase/phosphodiesterase n=1 Tax=Noviherbaspirillum sp. L7-7A TaxID=2850560 RepID=UPI001C2BEA72|nr:bifunctional diguanylate cyclase/phosphodiesterase [Noviherbaspirillum sp. L7-7A]MBV0881635.1 bifunctional diguanylate cyclase/phosphodiesterase [Noviherbaspirillum sp. L7-7A]